MEIFYMGLEPYEGRYTLQLQDWTERAYNKRGINYVVVPGTTIDDTKAISVGQVLDAHGRSYFGMSQLMNLVQMMRNGEVTKNDVKAWPRWRPGRLPAALSCSTKTQ